MRLYNSCCLDILSSLTEEVVIVTDPPFNVNYHYNQYKDNMSEENYYNFLHKILKGRPSVVIHYAEQLHKLSIKLQQAPNKVVSWVYNSNTPKQHRQVGFYNVVPDFTNAYQPYKNPNDKRIKKLIEQGKKGARLYDWWNVNQVKNVSKEKTNHPCQMPLQVMENIINILPKHLTVVDPFMGSGTTGVACKKLNRKFIGIELNQDYFQLAKQRIEEN